MTREELITVMIDQYGLLQHIKDANGGHENRELEYALKATIAKLSSYGISVKDLTF